MKKAKKILSCILSIIMMIGIIPLGTIQSSAATLTLSELQAKYPQGKYWNHVGSSSNNENGYTSTPCPSHYSTSTCNAYTYGGTKIGWQCFGFALKLGYDAYGSNPRDWGRSYNLNNIKPGDIINYDGSNPGHTVFVTKVSGDTVYFAECNWGGRCLIRWDRSLKKTQFNNLYNVYVAPYELTGGGTHIHSYSGSYYEAVHPHRVYQQCSCGATKYTGATKTVSSCAQCTMTIDTKYNTVKGFKSYPCVTSNFEVKTSDLTTRGGEIYTTDFCTINELYTNGWCKVTFPMDSGGTRTAYTKISNFIKSPSTALTKYTATSYINLYSTSSMSTQIYRIYPGDVCYTIGTSGSATQIFMPMSSGGYYVLGWASTSALKNTPSSTEKLNSGLTNLSTSSYAKCYTLTSGRYNVYTSSALSTRGYEGNASSTAWTGESDEIWIIGVGVNSAGTAYAKIKYPVGSSRYTAYVPLHSTLVPGSLTGSYRTATSKVTGFSDRPGGSTINSYWVDPGEKVYLLSQQNGYSQILYPTSNAWRIAWCTNSMYDSMFKAQTYTITYNANGGTGAPSSQTKTRDIDLTLSSTKPTRTGYTFIGWATSSSATTAQYSAGSKYANEASVTLYAVWRKQTYSITYNANSGENAPGVQTQTYGTAITVTNEKPSKTYSVKFNANGGTVDTQYYSFDCEFQGWSANANGSGTLIKSGSSYTPNKNVTLYAVYSNPKFESYPIPSREGYTFNGWYTAASGGTRLGTTSAISTDTTLYAQWEQETYSVIYYAEEATNLPVEQEKTNDVDLVLSNQIPVKSGYTFKGWTLDSESNTVDYLPGAKYTSNQSVILYAVWEKEAVPVTVTGISIQTIPTKTTYYIGDSINTSGLQLRLTYSDDSTEIISSGFTTSGFSSATAGTKTITVSYERKTTTFNVTVNTPTISLSATSKSMKVGETTTLTTTTAPSGQSVTWTSSNTSVATVSGGTVTAKSAGSATITAKFTCNGITYSKTCSVTITSAPDPEPTLSSISIVTNPTKTTYEIGEALNTSGLTLKLIYNDGSAKTISTGFTTSGFSSTTAGNKTVTVSYGGKTAMFNVNVKPKTPIDENKAKIIVESKQVQKSETFTVKVTLSNNPGFSYLEITPVYSPELTLVRVENGNLISDFTQGRQYVWVSDADTKSNGVLMTFTFTVDSSIASGKYEVGFNVRTCANYDEQLVAFDIVTGSVTVSDFVYGDANGDGEVNIKDATLIQKYLVQFVSFNDEQLKVADTNGDGKVDIRDVTQIQKYLVGFISSLG